MERVSAMRGICLLRCLANGSQDIFTRKTCGQTVGASRSELRASSGGSSVVARGSWSTLRRQTGSAWDSEYLLPARGANSA